MLISVVASCLNEEDNVDLLYQRLQAQFALLPDYRFEIILIDNGSTDDTVGKIKALCQRDRNVKLIVNTRNFGHIRSPVYAMLQARGDAVISIASDLQDPPELIPRFVEEWRKGYPIVAAVASGSQESVVMRLVRKGFYEAIGRISDIHLIRSFTGFGLYDKKVIDAVRQVDDPYPYFRGLVAELGYAAALVPFEKPARRRGITKNNFYTLYDLAMLGITSHSKVPIRLATMAGFALSLISLLISLVFVGLKLVFWQEFSLGQAPILIGLFFFSSVQLFFIGLLGEYVASIHTQVMKRPLVIEKERVNFDSAA